MITIRAARTVLDPADPPPGFGVRTDRAQAEVQLATDPVLFTGALAARRSARTFAAVPVEVVDGLGVAQLDAPAWARLGRTGYLAYRAVGWDPGAGGRRTRVVTTVADAAVTTAPALFVAPGGRQAPPPGRRLSGALDRLRVDRNRLVNPAGDPIVLRGIVRAGLESTERVQGPDRRWRTSRAAAGLDQADVRAMVRDWGATVIRLPLDQEWLLTRVDYVASVDQVIEWAAAEGAYTLLAVERLDPRRTFGTLSGGAANRLAPMPEENTVRAWRLLAGRYAAEPAVLYEPWAAPHVPLPDDRSFLFRPPSNEAGWIALWHTWVRRLEQVIHRAAPQAVIVVSGWDWGRSLRSFPVPIGAGRLPGAVYAARAERARLPAAPGDFEVHIGFPRLREIAPIFVSSWGGAAGDLAWADALERYVRARHRIDDGRWAGLAGWTAAAWGGTPPLLADAATRAPTEMGELVRSALRTSAFAAATGFDVARAAGSRARWIASFAGPARAGSTFVLRGHSFVPGTRLELRPTGGGAPVLLTPTLAGDHTLFVGELPATVPAGQYAVRAVTPTGFATEPIVVDVAAGAHEPAFSIMPGRAKTSPYTILFLANPWIEHADGTLERDGILGDHAAFGREVADAMQALFSYSERLLHAYAHELRVSLRFEDRPQALANSFCREDLGAYMAPARSRVADYLDARGIAADLCFVVYKSARRNLSAALEAGDDASAAARTFTYDGTRHVHRRRSDIPGTVALSAPSRQLTPLHEFMHACAELHQGQVADLYVDSAMTEFTVNRKRRVKATDPIPATFATMDGTAYASDPARAAAGGYGAFLSYHPVLVDSRRPNLMDNYTLADDPRRCRLDPLTLRFLRDRIEWKMQR